MGGIVLDIGTGDGKFVYKIAQDNPDKLVIGIDPNHSQLIGTSTKIYKKITRGGLKNAMYVLASSKSLPYELNGIVNQIFINFPWGELLKDVVEVDDVFWNKINNVCQYGAFVEIILGYENKIDFNEIKRLNLPPLNNNYITKFMIPKLNNIGFKKIVFTEFDSRNLKTYPTTWSKKLSFGKPRIYYYLKLKKI